MTTRTYNDERRWASTDPSLHCNGMTPTEPDWREGYLQALKDRNYDLAERIRSQNLISDECVAEAHGDCPIPETCTCPHHSVNQIALTHPALRSLSECQSEQEEIS